jgi:hypothetical protein
MPARRHPLERRRKPIVSARAVELFRELVELQEAGLNESRRYYDLLIMLDHQELGLSTADFSVMDVAADDELNVVNRESVLLRRELEAAARFGGNHQTPNGPAARFQRSVKTPNEATAQFSPGGKNR